MELDLNETEGTLAVGNPNLFSGIREVLAVMKLSNACGVEVTYVIFKGHIELGFLISLLVIQVLF